MKKAISKALLRLAGWKLGPVVEDVPKCVICVAPHTSNWDFIVGKLFYTSIGRNASFLIKKEWFFFPGKNPLDNSAVHPESYPIVERMAKDLKCSVADLITDKALKKKLKLTDYLTDKVGMPTLLDIMEELDKPGRDPRQTIQVFAFDPTVKTIEDLKEGQVLPGIVTNITNFGCFVDVGIKENGLVHISELADRFVSDPTQVVSIHQHVKVKVLSVDLSRKRVQLSMKGI